MDHFMMMELFFFYDVWISMFQFFTIDTIFIDFNFILIDVSHDTIFLFYFNYFGIIYEYVGMVR